MDSEKADDVVTAEAAAWLTRLHGAQRTAANEAAFRDWLNSDPAHQRAFARASEVWEIVPGAAQGMQEQRSRRAATSGTWRLAPALAAAASVVIAILGLVAVLALGPTTHATAVGEQQSFTLSDGTRVSLNTDSHITVSYSSNERRVRLERGEVLFEVAKSPQRPFVVTAGDEQVRALGTTFVVRKDPDAVAVTLIEGLVQVTQHRETRGVPKWNGLLVPGERVTFAAAANVARDRPALNVVTAWRRGEVMFDDVSLAEAVAEINRYGTVHVILTDPRLAQLRVSGVFDPHDAPEFALTMARLFGLEVTHGDSELLLTP